MIHLGVLIFLSTTGFILFVGTYKWCFNDFQTQLNAAYAGMRNLFSVLHPQDISFTYTKHSKKTTDTCNNLLMGGSGDIF